MEWEVHDGKRVIGSFSEEQILQAIAGTLPVTTLIRPVGEEEWRPAGGHLPFAEAFARREQIRAAAAAPPSGATAPTAGRAASPRESDIAGVPKPVLGTWQAKLIAILCFSLVSVIVIAILYSRSDGVVCNDKIAEATDEIRIQAMDAAEKSLRDAKRACKNFKQSEIAALETQVADYRASIHAAATAAAARIAANEAENTRQMDAAANVWAALEKIPLERRTKQMWKDALVESTGHCQGLPAGTLQTCIDANLALARKNMAPIINTESQATGPYFTVLIPSSDPIKCRLWASMWLADETSLQTAGFRKVHCDGERRTSKVTGEVITEPATEWTVSADP